MTEKENFRFLEVKKQTIYESIPMVIENCGYVIHDIEYHKDGHFIDISIRVEDVPSEKVCNDLL